MVRSTSSSEWFRVIPPSLGRTETGMGDITMRIANKTFANEGGATWFLALDPTWDAASDATQGKGKNLAAPTIFGFIKLPSLGILAFSLKYNVEIG